MPKAKYSPESALISDENREILKVICMPGWKYIKDLLCQPKMALEAERDQLLRQKSGVKGQDVDNLNFVLARLRERELIMAELEALEDEVKPEEISPAKA